MCGELHFKFLFIFTGLYPVSCVDGHMLYYTGVLLFDVSVLYRFLTNISVTNINVNYSSIKKYGYTARQG